LRDPENRGARALFPSLAEEPSALVSLRSRGLATKKDALSMGFSGTSHAPDKDRTFVPEPREANLAARSARATRGLGLPIPSSRLEKHAEHLMYFREVFEGVRFPEGESRAFVRR
jgi:hypothetical protein